MRLSISFIPDAAALPLCEGHAELLAPDVFCYIGANTSTSTTQATVMKQTRTQLGRRAFSVAGPDVGNGPPPEIRRTKNFARLKTN